MSAKPSGLKRHADKVEVRVETVDLQGILDNRRPVVPSPVVYKHTWPPPMAPVFTAGRGIAAQDIGGGWYRNSGGKLCADPFAVSEARL